MTTGLSLRERLIERGVLGDVLAVCQALRVPLHDVLGTSRLKSIVAARAACMKRLRLRGLSLPEIGWLFGRHHTSVLNLCRKAGEE